MTDEDDDKASNIEEIINTIGKLSEATNKFFAFLITLAIAFGSLSIWLYLNRIDSKYLMNFSFDIVPLAIRSSLSYLLIIFSILMLLAVVPLNLLSLFNQFEETIKNISKEAPKLLDWLILLCIPLIFFIVYLFIVDIQLFKISIFIYFLISLTLCFISTIFFYRCYIFKERFKLKSIKNISFYIFMMCLVSSISYLPFFGIIKLIEGSSYLKEVSYFNHIIIVGIILFIFNLITSYIFSREKTFINKCTNIIYLCFLTVIPLSFISFSALSYNSNILIGVADDINIEKVYRFKFSDIEPEIVLIKQIDKAFFEKSISPLTNVNVQKEKKSCDSIEQISNNVICFEGYVYIDYYAVARFGKTLILCSKHKNNISKVHTNGQCIDFSNYSYKIVNRDIYKTLQNIFNSN